MVGDSFIARRHGISYHEDGRVDCRCDPCLVAQAIFAADWPGDKWSNHFDVGKVPGPDMEAKRYLKLAEAAIAVVNALHK